ncbi:hypothetical protein XENOCAPTIV_017519 [Xenoophorus captivus]|uniref:G-protein coupled receptors family 1 profile domain-containing protein n=1 Tax=Xenoophorus captivus TaxID=1517983 RepID=A0ABV0RHT5_9TELE
MEFEDYLNVTIWINIRVCFPFTILAIGLCCMVHLDHCPVTYYLNLLIANLVQLITLVVLVLTRDGHNLNLACLIICCSAAMVSLYFRMIIALERYFFISWPQLLFIIQTKGSVIICVLVWVLCMVLLPLLISSGFEISVFVFALIPFPVFLFCPLGTCISLPRATSVCAERKRRIVGTFVLLLVNYGVTIILPASAFILYRFYGPYLVTQIFLTLFLLSSFMDLFLFVFMHEGPIDKVLMCLCCCRMNTSAVDDGSRL